jgi:uncharacterized protein YndB with AHSA1/START domain
MGKNQVVFEEVFLAPRAKVFALFADHERFGRVWGGTFTRIKPGEDPNDPNGLGSVRKVRSQGLTFEETIVTYRPGALIEYQVTKGSPIKNHLGHIEFSDAPGGGTHVRYSITFDPRIPLTGKLIESALRGSWDKGKGRVMESL